MAKLNKEKAKQAAEASSGFEPVADGAYHAALRSVDPDRNGKAGPYWTWEFEIVEPGDAKGRRMWNNTSLADQSIWTFNQTFEAFGVDTDTDTDELLGRVVKLIVSTRTIQEGARKGELANQVNRVVKADPDFEVPEGVAANTGAGKSDGEDIFD